jgi:hypothetical protein
MRKMVSLLIGIIILGNTGIFPALARAEGWYLLAPTGDPPRSKTGEFIWSIAIHEWGVVQSFDRANSCEEARAFNTESWTREVKERRQAYYDRKSYPAGWEKNDPDWPVWLRRRVDDSERELARARLAQCISNVDPRLAPKSRK